MLVVLSLLVPSLSARFPQATSAPHSLLPTSAVSDVTAPPSSLAGVVSAVHLGISATPTAICAFNTTNCSAGTGTARVTMSASLGGRTSSNFSAVQLVFVVDTSPYAGVYDARAADPGGDPCAMALGGTQLPCEESNGVPFFVAHAAQLARAIQLAHPRANVSFAMVDYFASGDSLDDGDGSTYHVDIANFTSNATTFGALVVSGFQHQVLGGSYVSNDSDLSDNILHGPSITALYGALGGSGLNWSNATHHVLVWMGVTAPRDPHYVQDYCVSPWASAGSLTCSGNASTGWSPGCEPSYSFPIGFSPTCEGWVTAPGGRANDSIAAYTLTGANCAGSLGGRCTIDTIDLFASPTDPNSKSWPAGAGTGGGPGGTNVTRNTDRVLQAGCDIANATGGSWDGPNFFTCPNGEAGTLQYVSVGSNSLTNTTNPTLLGAFTNVSFGVAVGYPAPPAAPMFAFRPWVGVLLAPSPDYSTLCSTPKGALPTCQGAPDVRTVNGSPLLTWNWSTNSSSNRLTPGDDWSASFNVVVASSSYGPFPLDACSAPGCLAGGSAPVSGFISAFHFVGGPIGAVAEQSFPLATVRLNPPTNVSALATALPSEGYAPLPVQFTASASGGAPPYTASWSFGDSSASVNGMWVNHTFTRSGSYLVELQVQDYAGDVTTAGITVIAQAVSGPVLTIGHLNRTTTDVGFPVDLSAASSGGAPPYWYTWNGLPDGCTAPNESYFSCTPTNAGIFFIDVTTHDTRGGSSAPAHLQLIVAPDPSVNISALAWDNCSASNPVPIGLDLAASVVGGSLPFTFTWRLGDGGTGSTSQVSHAYPSPGLYPVTVEVRDGAGALAQRTLVVEVGTPTCSGFSTSQHAGYSLSPGAWAGVALLAIGLGAVATAIGLRLRHRTR